MDYLERCGICTGQFRMPRGLPCLHSFCQDCLEGLIAGQLLSVEVGKSFSCPTCGKRHLLPVNLVQGFPVDVKVPNIENIPDGLDLYCDKHPTKTKTWYCKDCKITTCSVCYKLFHEGHLIESHEKIIRKLKIEVRETLEKNENRIQFYREKMDLLESSKDEIDTHTHKTVRYIKSRVDFITKRVNRAAEKMVKKVVAHNKTQKKAIQESISDLYKLTENYRELCSDIDGLENNGSNSEFLRSGSKERIECFTKNANIEREIPESWEKMILQLSKLDSDDDVFAKLMIGWFMYDKIGIDFDYMNHGITDAHRGTLQFEMDEDSSTGSSFHDIAILDDSDSGLCLRVAKGIKMKSVCQMSELDKNSQMATQSPDFGLSPSKSFNTRIDNQNDVPIVYSVSATRSIGFKEQACSPSVSSKGQPISQAPVSITDPTQMKIVGSLEVDSSQLTFYTGTPPQKDIPDSSPTIQSLNPSESLLKRSSSQVKIIYERALKTDFHGHGFALFVDRNSHMIWSGCTGDGWTLQERDQSGNIVWEKKPQDWAKVMPASLTIVTQGDTQYIAAAFPYMRHIKLINILSDQEILAYEHFNQEPHKLQWLPPYNMLLLDRSKFPVAVHVLDCSRLPWSHIKSINTGLNFAHEFTSVQTPEGVYAVVTSLDDFSIRAFHLDSGTLVWDLHGKVDGHLLLPGGLAADSQGHIYITDTTNRRLLVVNIAGHVIQALSTAARPTSVDIFPGGNKLLVKHMADGKWVLSVWGVEPE